MTYWFGVVFATIGVHEIQVTLKFCLAPISTVKYVTNIAHFKCISMKHLLQIVKVLGHSCEVHRIADHFVIVGGLGLGHFLQEWIRVFLA